MEGVTKPEAGNDPITRIPDALLLQILSNLRMKDLVRTCVLSKRWRYLWTVTPTLDFREEEKRKNTSLDFEEDEEETRESAIDIVKFINCSLIAHESVKVDKLCISISYENCHACQVTSWIRFALRHNVEELHLDFLAGNLCFEEFDSEYLQLYELPQCIFLSDSLVSLTLKFCHLKCPSSISVSSLRTLHLQQMLITSDVLHKLLLGCPLLESLDIADCNRTRDIIIKTDQKLETVRIEDTYYIQGSDALIEIDAPKLLSLELYGNCPRADYKLLKASSLEKVGIDFEWMFVEYQKEYGSDYCDLDALRKLLEDLSHVKHLHLCSWCVQVMSIRELKCLDTPVLSAACLELKTGMTAFELPGFVHLLKSCCELATLILRIDNKLAINTYNWLDSQEAYVNEKQYLKWLELCFSRLLQYLKTVKIYGFLGGGDFSELELGSEGVKSLMSSMGVTSFLSSRHREIQFVKLLLKNSKALEKLVICTTSSPFFKDWSEKSKLMTKLRDQIMGFPRANPYAELVICES